MFDLETQGHPHFSYDLAYLRHYASYWLDLGVDSNIIKGMDFKKSILNNLTFIVDLDFQSQTNFFQVCLIFKVNHHSYTLSVLDFLSSSTSTMQKSILKSSLWHLFSQR